MATESQHSHRGRSDSLNERREDFVRRVSWGAKVLEQLSREQMELTHVRRGSSDLVWYLRIRLPNHLQEGFGTAPEVLVLAVKGEVQGRDLEGARAELYRSGFRLDLDLLVVLDEKPQLHERLQRMPARWGQWIPWPIVEDPQVALAEQLRRFLPTFDVYAKQDPVRGREVFGRAGEIADITTRIERGESVGVFGLRKVGKTTVVRAATDILDPVSVRLSFNQAPSRDEISEARTRVAWLDVQRVFDRSKDRFLRLLAEAVQRRFQADQASLPFLPTDPLDRLDRLCATLIDSEIPLCIVLDEYDFLFEGEGNEPAIPGVAELLRLLRGWAQETKRLSIVVIGRDPRFFQRSHLGGFPNPMWFAILLTAGGNPALLTYGLERLWETASPTEFSVATIFAEFRERHSDFLKSFERSFADPDVSSVPAAVLRLARATVSAIPRARLLEATKDTGPAKLNLDDALLVLKAAGLVRVVGSALADPLELHPISTLINSPEPSGGVGVGFRTALVRDSLVLLAHVHSLGVDFYRAGKSAGAKLLVPESVFSAVVAVALGTMGWTLEREAVSGAGRTDLKVSRPTIEENAIMEVKIWGRNDYRDIQRQVLAYSSRKTTFGLAVMILGGDVAEWKETYRRERSRGAGSRT